MIKKRSKDVAFSKETLVFIGLTAACVALLFNYVDLTPKVDYQVFFSTEDPNYKADVEISRLFPRNDDQIIISVSGDIHSKPYQEKIKELGDLLIELELINDVKSIRHGPKNVNAAIRSPFWSRLLISDEGRSSNLVAILEDDAQDQLTQLIPKVEALKDIFDAPDFKVNLSGFPYIVELIRRHLNEDLRAFSFYAFLLFGLIVILVFHSTRILIGMIITCFNAAAFTLTITHLLNIKIGILTANLTTIVFVLTLSHIVFLTFNWKHLYHIRDRIQATTEAVKMTLPASFWAMITTLLGFLSLLFVQAKPIRELGVSGSIGAFIAFILAYAIYPAFLRLQRPTHERADISIKHFFLRSLNFLEKRQWIVIAFIFSIVLITAPDLKRLNMDPSLIDFFRQDSPITQGLEYIDKHGGSNPLIAVVKSNDGEPLDTKENIAKLWGIQNEFENHHDVGTVISMPLLLSEAERSTIFSSWFSKRKLLDILDKPKYGNITQEFVSKNRQHALFLLRMNEAGRTGNRLGVIDELDQIIIKNQMHPHLMGGIYALQGHLSRHVSSSLIFGLTRLIAIFAIIALLCSHSIRGAFGMTFSICLVPLCILGTIATLRIPLDIIAAPASNIAISMGIDAMIHMVHAYRRLKKKSKTHKNIWHEVRMKMWEPIITSMIIVSCGFGIFFLSMFPPTQRFGGSIVLGTIVAALSALFVFPMFTSPITARVKKQTKTKPEKTEQNNRLENIPPESADKFPEDPHRN